MRPDSPHSREELAALEAKLHEDLRLTEQAYQEAKDEAARLRNISGDLGAITHPDGTAAMLHSIRMENRALSNYCAALKAFNEFVLDYKLPRDLPDRPESRKQK